MQSPKRQKTGTQLCPSPSHALHPMAAAIYAARTHMHARTRTQAVAIAISLTHKTATARKRGREGGFVAQFSCFPFAFEQFSRRSLALTLCASLHPALAALGKFGLQWLAAHENRGSFIQVWALESATTCTQNSQNFLKNIKITRRAENSSINAKRVAVSWKISNIFGNISCFVQLCVCVEQKSEQPGKIPTKKKTLFWECENIFNIEKLRKLQHLKKSREQQWTIECEIPFKVYQQLNWPLSTIDIVPHLRHFHYFVVRL